MVTSETDICNIQPDRCWSMSEADIDISEASIEAFSICFLFGVTAWLLTLKMVLLFSKQKQGNSLSCQIPFMIPPFYTVDIKTFRQDLTDLGPAHPFWIVTVYPDYPAVGGYVPVKAVLQCKKYPIFMDDQDPTGISAVSMNTKVDLRRHRLENTVDYSWT